jgi:hypothetical protein
MALPPHHVTTDGSKPKIQHWGTPMPRHSHPKHTKFHTNQSNGLRDTRINTRTCMCTHTRVHTQTHTATAKALQAYDQPLRKKSSPKIYLYRQLFCGMYNNRTATQNPQSTPDDNTQWTTGFSHNPPPPTIWFSVWNLLGCSGCNSSLLSMNPLTRPDAMPELSPF